MAEVYDALVMARIEKAVSDLAIESVRRIMRAAENGEGMGVAYATLGEPDDPHAAVAVALDDGSAARLIRAIRDEGDGAKNAPFEKVVEPSEETP